MKILFHHIPKTAGSSLFCFMRKNLADTDNEFVKSSHKVIESRPDDVDYMFAIVRDPIDRFVSTWNYYVYGESGIFNSIMGDFLKYKYGNPNAFIADPRIEEYLERISHFRRMADIITNTDFYDFIGRFENIEGDSNRIFQDVNLEIKYKDMFRHNDSSNFETKIEIQDLSEDSIKVLKEYYDEDFKRFGYIDT